MGLQINKVLENGVEANYFVIEKGVFNKNPNSLTIYIAGFKDKDFRDANYDLLGEKAIVFRDTLNLSGGAFTEEIYNSFVVGGFPYLYSLLKDKIDYLQNAIEV